MVYLKFFYIDEWKDYSLNFSLLGFKFYGFLDEFLAPPSGKSEIHWKPTGLFYTLLNDKMS